MHHHVGGHRASMASSADSQPSRIGQPAGYQILCACGHIINFTAVGVFYIQIAESLAVAAAAAIVWLQHNISGLGQILRPQVGAEVILALGPAMDPNYR